MKQLLSSLTIMIFAVAYLTGCAQDPNSSAGFMPMKTSPPPAANAHPAWTYRNNITVKSHGVNIPYATVAVSDDGGANSANVYTCATDANNGVIIASPTWSSNGASISFIEKPVGTGNSSPLLKAIDVSVVNGVAKGTNARTIYTSTNNIVAQAWCPVASNAKIAFITKTTAGAYSVYTVSTSGGAATNIYNAAAGDLTGACITWSNDGTQLAFTYKTGTTISIKVIDAATGAENANLVAGSYVNISHVVWSNSGLNNLTFDATTTSGGSVADYNLYTIVPTNGSTETLVTAGFNPFWSPDNSVLVFEDAFSNTKKVVVATSVVTTVGSYIPFGDWK